MNSEPPLGKKCSLCGLLKPMEDFHKDKHRHDGLYPYCKPCNNAYNRNFAAKPEQKERKALRERTRRLANPEAYRAYHRERASLPHRKANKRMYGKQYHNEIKRQTLERLGNLCVCCGESNPHFLTIDHKDNNGAQERLSLSGKTLYSLIARGKVTDLTPYQVLCWNCNCAKQFSGLGCCPHSLRTSGV